MAMQIVDYNAVINDLERRRHEIDAQFDSAIAAIRRVMALQSLSGQAILPGISLPTNSGTSTYRGMSAITAAITHIKSVGHPVPNLLLAKALADGGYEHKSRNFPNTLNSILWRRAKTMGDVRKLPGGWGLSEQAQ
ncbi:MAG: hypothetical protein HOP16_06770 [Acidobacteria bacterium]|nr:hypothetical protein [Acidobacteriota bacterium]